MSKVLLDLSVSLDRFVAGPNGEDGGPHVTPLIAVWLDDALYFCTGPDERKARNPARNPYCLVTTGSNALGEGFDVVVEGWAQRASRSSAKGPGCSTRYTSTWRPSCSEGASG